MLFPEDKFFGGSPQADKDFKRLDVPYVSRSDKFHFRTKDFSKQFSHIYASRLDEMVGLLTERAKEKWGEFFRVNVVIRCLFTSFTAYRNRTPNQAAG